MTFAQRLSDLMAEQKCTNYQLAKDLGKHATTVANWLNGSIPHTKALSEIAEYFGVSIAYLIGESDERGNADIKKEPAQSGSSDLDMLFLNAMHQLSPDEQLSIMAAIHSLLEKK